MKEETAPTDAAMGAVLDVLSKDGSPYVRAAVLERLIRTRWKKLPASLGAPVLQLAKRPTDMPEDALGMVLVRRAAITLLGKIDFNEGRRYVLDELAKRELDVNYLPGYARGAALIATPDSIGVLRAALKTQEARGYAYYKPAVEALATTQSLEAWPSIIEEVKANISNNEIMRGVIYALDENRTLKDSAEFPPRVKEWVLDDKGGSLDLKMRLLGLLEDVKTKEAKEALNVIADKSPYERVKGMAKQLLDANFKAAGATPKK
jgi:hypothetical protein